LLNRVGQPPEGGHLCANGVHVALLEKIGDPKAPAHEQSVGVAGALDSSISSRDH